MRRFRLIEGPEKEMTSGITLIRSPGRQDPLVFCLWDILRIFYGFRDGFELIHIGVLD